VAETHAHEANIAPDGRIADLLAVLEVTRRLAATSELQPLLEVIEQSALKVLDCERASVFLHDRTTDELYSRVATGGRPVRFPASLGFAGGVFRSGQVANVPDAYADPRFNPAVDRQTGFRTRSILTCPLSGWDNTTVGVLQVLNKRSGPFDTWDEILAQTFGAQVGVAVQRQLLLEEYERKRRYERALEIARQIQQGLLPGRSPQRAGLRRRRLEPAGRRDRRRHLRLSGSSPAGSWPSRSPTPAATASARRWSSPSAGRCSARPWPAPPRSTRPSRGSTNCSPRTWPAIGS
jgi:GAF domain-containing protein